MKNEFVSSPARPEIYDWISSDLIDSLAMVESGGKHLDADGNLTESPSGALGKYQWMPKSAKDPGYGVEPFDITDENAQRNATKQYLVGIQRKHPDWTPAQVLQAYNAGPGKMSRHMAGEKNLDGSSILKKETINYPGKVFAGMPAEEESGFPNYAPPMPPPVNQNEVPTYAKNEDPIESAKEEAKSAATDYAVDTLLGTSQAVGSMPRNRTINTQAPSSFDRKEKSGGSFNNAEDYSGNIEKVLSGDSSVTNLSTQENKFITDLFKKFEGLPAEERNKRIKEEYNKNFIGGARIGAARGLASVPPLYLRGGTDSVPMPGNLPKQYVEKRFGGDIVPSMLTPGEAVIPVEAAQHPRFKPMINEMISYGRGVQDLNKGTSGVQYYGGGTENANNDGGGFFSNIWNWISSQQVDFKEDPNIDQSKKEAYEKKFSYSTLLNEDNKEEEIVEDDGNKYKYVDGERVIDNTPEESWSVPEWLKGGLAKNPERLEEFKEDIKGGHLKDELGGSAMYQWQPKDESSIPPEYEESDRLGGSFTPELVTGKRGEFSYTDKITGNKISVNENGDSTVTVNPEILYGRGWTPKTGDKDKGKGNSFNVTESLDGFLEYFGWERKDAARLLLYYVGSRMTGASHGGSLAWAGQQALSDISGRKDRAATQASANSRALNAFQSDYNQDKELFTEEYRVAIQEAINKEDLNAARALVQQAYQQDKNGNYMGLHPLALQVNLSQREMFRNVQGGPVFNAFQSNDGKGYKFINSAGNIELITNDNKQYEMTNLDIASDNFMEEAGNVWDDLTNAEKNVLSKYFTGTENDARTMGKNSWQAQLGQFLIDNKIAQEKSASVMTNDIITLIKGGNLPKENKPTVRGLLEWMVVHDGMDASWIKALPIKSSGNNMTPAAIRNLQKDLNSEVKGINVNTIIRKTDKELADKHKIILGDVDTIQGLAQIKELVLETLDSGTLGISEAETNRIKGLADNANPYIALLHINKIRMENSKRN